MPTPLIITLPTKADDVRREIEQRLQQQANIHEQPPSLGLEEVKLIVEIVVGGAMLIKTLLEIKELYVKQGQANNIRIGQIGGRSVRLAEVDEALLRQLLGVSEEDGQ